MTQDLYLTYIVSKMLNIQNHDKNSPEALAEQVFEILETPCKRPLVGKDVRL